MKIAVYITGQIRHLNISWKTILNLFHTHEVDFYFHLWENIDYSQEWLLDTLKPINYKLEPQIDFMPQIQKTNANWNHIKCSRHFFRLFSQYYSLCQFENIIQNIDMYDFVLKIRTDLYFESSLDSLLELIKPDKLFISPCGGAPPGDMVFLANPLIFRKLALLYNFLSRPDERLINMRDKKLREQSINSHKVISIFLNSYGIQDEQIPFHFILLLPGVVGNNYTEVMRSYKKIIKAAHTKHRLFYANNPDRVEEFKKI